MTCIKRVRRARTPGGLAAGLALAALLAGCGGGGGGGGGSSSNSGNNGGGTTQQPEVVVAGPTSVPTGGGTVGNVTASTPTPELDIPAGVLSTATSFTISTDPNAPALPSGYTVESSVYDIQPSGTQFGGTGITIKLPYNTSAANPSYLQVYYYDAPSSTWQPVGSGGRPSSVTDTTNHDVAAQATQIATGRTNGSGPADYVVLGPPAPPATPSARTQ